MLCPVLTQAPFSVALVMRRATPLSTDDHEALLESDGFPEWDYVPPDETCPFEYKASDWGRLTDRRLVALDYSSPALSDPVELELAKAQARRKD
jgi:hypothetical protein